MKYLLIAMLVLCGSLKKDDRVKCPEKVKVEHYLNGRFVAKDILKSIHGGPRIITLTTGKDVISDSMVYSLSY